MGQENSCPMKFATFLLLFAVFATGCSKPVPPAPPTEQRPPAKAVATPAPSGKPVAKISYAGTWAVTDDQGQVFDIAVFSNGQAASNWTKGHAGARGERGFWRVENNRLFVFFQDGWTDVISGADGEFEHRGFEPGATLEGPPKNQSAAKRLEGAGFVGVWCLNKEPDGSHLYVALQSSGRAFSSIGGGTEGTWEVTKEGALCKWPDGWNDLIYPVDGAFQKRSWVGPAGQETAPPDISPAVRVGEAGFFITP
jgi:hypothetical protein